DQTAPSSATPAATPKAGAMPTERATTPSTIGPAPRPRSMNALAVPETAPRSPGPAVANIAAKYAGVLNVMPNPMTAAPTTIPAGVAHTATIASPAAMVASAAAPRRSGGSRSGTLANAILHATTTTPYTSTGTLA